MNGPVDRDEHRQAAFELAALDAVGTLSPDDAEGWFRAHVSDGCAICREAVARVAEVFDDLLLAASPVQPPPELRDRLLAAVRAGADRARAERGAAAPAGDDVQVWNRWRSTGPSKFYTVAATEDDWEEIAIPGIAVRSLHVDEQRDQVTMLIRMAPGTSYPRHRHAEDEQCFVLEGDLRVEDEVLGAGDYQFAPANSIHGVQSTEGGCLLLVVSSRHDELLSG